MVSKASLFPALHPSISSASIAQLAGGSTFVPKGLYRFRTHEEANEKAASWLAAGMARIALERKHGWVRQGGDA